MIITIREKTRTGKILKVSTSISLNEVIENEASLEKTFNKLINDFSLLLREETERIEKAMKEGPKLILPPRFDSNGTNHG